MSPTAPKSDGATRLIDTIEHAEQASLQAVRNFVETVDSVVPHVGGEPGPRRTIIDSAFDMTRQLVGASNNLARSILETTERSVARTSGKPGPAPKA